MSTIPPLQAIGPYTLLREVEDGPIGTSFESTSPASGSRCLVTVFLSDFAKAPEFRTRFREECAAAQQVHHLHLARLLDFDIDESGFPYTVSEMPDGEPLSSLVHDGRPLRQSEAVRVIQEVAEALHELHRVRSLHRDIRPGSVLVTPYGNARLTNLGRGGLLPYDQFRLPNGVFLGSPYYLPPEVTLGRPHTVESDIYSLACLSFHLLAGRPPYQGDTADEVIRQHASAPAPRLVESVRGIHVPISEIIEECLAKEPTGRYQSLETFLLDWRPMAKQLAEASAGGTGNRSTSAFSNFATGSRSALNLADDPAGSGLKLRVPADTSGLRAMEPSYDPGFKTGQSPLMTSDDDLSEIMPRKGAGGFEPHASSHGGVSMIPSHVNPMGISQDIYGRGDRDMMSRLRQTGPVRTQRGLGFYIVVGLVLMGAVVGGITVTTMEEIPLAHLFKESGNSGARAEYEKNLRTWNETQTSIQELVYYIYQYERLNGEKPKIRDLVRESIATEEQILDPYGNEFIYDAINDEITSMGEDGRRFTNDDFIYNVGRQRYTSMPSKPISPEEQSGF